MSDLLSVYDTKKWMELAFNESQKSNAIRLKVGAVLLGCNKSGKCEVLSTGYNRMYDDTRCEGTNSKGELVSFNSVLHAETECLRKVFDDPEKLKRFVHFKNKTMYLTDSPCIHCAKVLYTCGIKEVIFSRKYRITEGIDFLSDVGVNCIHLKEYEDNSTEFRGSANLRNSLM